MAVNDFIVNLVAGLSKTKSKQQIKSDAKSLGDMYVKLIGNLDMPKTRKAIKAQLKGLNNLTFNITPNVNTKGVQSATRQAINNAQRVANSNKVHLNFDTNKQHLINQIKILGRNNNKLFSDQNMTAKYNQLLNSASVAKSTGELKTLRGELSAFKTELVATNNAGLTWGSKFKKSIESYAKFFSGASMIYALSNQVRNAATEAKTLDDSLVDLQKVTNEIGDRDALYKYFDKSLSKAQELNVKVGSLIDAVTEFKKLGWDLDDAELGAKWANILSNVGDVEIDTAIGSIKTSIASFDEIGGYGNDQMDKKLEAYTDLINNMSNKYSIDAEGLAESIRLSAGTLTEAHMSIEQAATMFATANKYYNSPSYLGNAAKIGSLRMRASSGDTDAIEELQEMGEEVDDLATATSNLREKLMALTGVDIMEDEHTFKSYYDQLYEISQVMDKLDDTSRANVLETMFGKSRSAAGAAILSGMKESASAYEDAINSAGSSTEEYQVWMTSADAACQRFSNTLTETYQGIINGNTVRDLANLGSAVLEFANNWGIVEGTLKGVIALGIGKFIATGGMALITATKQVEQYGKALQMASNVPNGNLSARFQALKSIAQATSTLTTKQLRNVLATNTLTQADRVRILQMQGMTKEMGLQKLAEMNLTQATNAQTAANTASTASTFSLKAAMTGLGATLKSVFLNNLVGIVLMGISLGVSAVTSAVSKHNQAVEEAIEFTDELKSKYEELNSEYESHKRIVDELASSYEKLSKGVDVATNKNISLSDEDYKEYLRITNELVDVFPSLYKTLDDNGNAILTLGQNGRTASEDLQELLKAEEDLNNFKISQDIDGLFGGVKVKIDEANKSMEEYTANSAELEKSFETIKEISQNGIDLSSDEFTLSADLSNSGGIEYYNALTKALQNFNKELDASRRVDLNGLFDPANVIQQTGDMTYDFNIFLTPLSDEEKKRLQNEIKSQTAEIIPLIQDEITANFTEQSQKQQEADLAWKDFIPSLVATMKSKGSFKELAEGEFGEDIQNFAIDLVSNLDTSVASEMDKNNPYAWVRNNIILPLTQLDESGKKEISEAYGNLLELNPDDLSEVNQTAIDKFIKQIADLLGLSPIDVRLNLGFEVDEDLKTKYDAAVTKSIEKLGISKKEVETIFTDLGIDTTSEIDKWNNITDSINNSTEAKKKYLGADISHGKTIPSTFKDLWKSIGKGDDDASKAAKSAKEEILKLAEAGKLTEKAFKKSSIADTFTNAGYSIKETTKKINRMVDSSKQLSSLKSSISSIQNAYQEKKDNKVANSSTLAGMEDIFGKLSSWEKYKNILGSASSTLKECKIAQNELATEFVYSNNFLSQLTSKNKEYYTSQLKELGIANAQSIVENTLKAKKQALANETKALEAATSDLSGETNNASEKFLEQANMTNLAKVELVNLITQQKIFGVQGLDTSTKVEQLNKLALAYFGVANAIQVSNTSAMGVDPRYYTDDWIQKQWNNLMDQQTKISVDNVKVTPSKTKDSSKKTKNSSKSSNSNSKDTKQEIDWLSRRLTRMQSIIDLTASKLKNLFKIDEKENNINKQIKQTTKLINQYGHAYDVYMSKANKIAKASGKGKNKVPALSKDIINKIQSGEITKSSYKKLIKKYGKDYADKINGYIDYYDKAQDSLKSKEEQIANRRELKKSKIQLRIDDTQSKIDRADSRIENVTSASEKNKILDNEKKYYKELYNQKIKQAELDENSVEVGKLKAEQKKQERDLSIEQHQNNIDEKQSTLDVLEAQKENVTSASEKNAIIDQELALKKEICNEELAIAKLNGDQNEQEHLKKQLLFEEKKAQLEQIANMKDEFDLKKNALSRDEAELQQQIAENEAKGVGQSIKDYRKQIALSEGRQKKLRDEKEYWEAQLAEQLTSGKIVASESDAAYKELKDNIASCDEGISSCIVDQINWNKAIREMNYKNYETLLNLLDMAYKKLENLKSIREAHGKELTDDEILKLIKIDDKIINTSKSAMESVKKSLSDAFTNGDYGFKLNTEQIDEFMDYLEYAPDKIPNLMKSFGIENFNKDTYSGIFDEIEKFTTNNDNWVQALVDAEGLSDEIGQKIIDHANEYLEALKKQKEYKDRIFAIEKAQYDLEKAKNNLTKKVWDGQQWVYTADTEAVQSAQETLDNTMFELFNNSIQDLIEVIEQFNKDFNIYNDNGDMINNPKAMLNKGVLGKYTIVDIDKIFTDKVLDTSKLSGLMSNIQYAIPNVSIPNINLPKIQSKAMNQTVNYDKIELILPNITDASTGADLTKSFVNELKNLSSYAKQYDWNK